MRKEVEFKAKFDTSDFDKSVESMQKKLREIYQPSDIARAQQNTSQRLENMGYGGIMSKPTQESYQRSTQAARRELDQSITKEAQGQEKLGKFIAARADKLEQLKKTQQDLVKGSEEELKVKEKIARMEENLFRQREGYRQRDASLNQMLNAKQKNMMSPEALLGAYKEGGLRGAASHIGGAVKGMGMPGWLGMAGSAIGALGVGAGQFADWYRSYTRMPVEAAAAMGSATQNSVGRDVQNIYGRRSVFEAPWMQERARAAQRALDSMNGARTSDAIGLGGNMLKWGGAGMGTGAAIGSVVPGVGSAIGAGVGGLVGGVTGFLRADPREKALLASKLPFIGGHYKQQYESMVADQAGKDYQSGIEAEKNMNPYKKAAIGEYEGNFMRNLQFQRSLGLNNEQFYGNNGFQKDAINKGFTPEMSMEMSNNILSAGGSTRMGRNSAFGLQLQRGLDMTNSGSVLGTLSGSMGSSESTKQATIKLLAEGMKMGLDDSQFAEENRKFTQAAADVISKTGTNSEDDISRILDRFSSGLTENTGKGIQAAKSSYEEYQKMSAETTGPRGVMRAAGFMSDPDLNKLPTLDKQAVMQMPEEQLTEDNVVVQSAAKKAGLPTSKFIEKVKNLNQRSTSRYKEYDDAVQRLKDVQSKTGKKITRENLREFPSEVQEDFASVSKYQTLERGAAPDLTTMYSRVGTAIGNAENPADIQKDRESVIKKKAEGASGRMEDNTIAAMAGDASTVLKNFNEMRGGMDAAAKSAAAFTDQIREMNAAMMKALDDARTGNGNYADAMKKFLQSTTNMPKTQDQAGRTK